jgi:hypothetical protein
VRSLFFLCVAIQGALAVAAVLGCRGHRRRDYIGKAAGALEVAFDAATPDGTAPARPSLLRVPSASAALVPTGHFDVNVWANAANTHTLLDERGQGAVPVSEARLLWGSGHLYVFFYAADLDLQVRTTKHDGRVWADDGVVLEFPSPGERKFVIDVSPTAVVADGVCPQDAADLGDARCDLHWESGARVGADYDGTINTLGDFDEEWTVEVAVPLASIGVRPPFEAGRIPFSLIRCERAHEGKRACGSWGRSPGPGVLVLAP